MQFDRLSKVLSILIIEDKCLNEKRFEAIKMDKEVYIGGLCKQFNRFNCMPAVTDIVMCSKNVNYYADFDTCRETYS